MEWNHREPSAAQGFHFVGGALFEVAFAQVIGDAPRQFRTFGFAGLVLVRRKERGKGGIADETHEVEEFICLFQFLALELGRAVVVAQAEKVLPFAQGGGGAFADFLFPELAGGEPGFPGKGFDLSAGKAYEGIAAANGVVEEGEGMVLGQRGEPERESLARSTAMGLRSTP